MAERTSAGEPARAELAGPDRSGRAFRLPHFFLRKVLVSYPPQPPLTRRHKHGRRLSVLPISRSPAASLTEADRPHPPSSDLRHTPSLSVALSPSISTQQSHRHPLLLSSLSSLQLHQPWILWHACASLRSGPRLGSSFPSHLLPHPPTSLPLPISRK